MWASRAAASYMWPTIRAPFRRKPNKIRVVLRRSRRFPCSIRRALSRALKCSRAPSRFLSVIERRLSCAQRRVYATRQRSSMWRKKRRAPPRKVSRKTIPDGLFSLREHIAVIKKSTIDWRRSPMSSRAHALPRRRAVWRRKTFRVSTPLKTTAMRRRSASRAAACRPRMRKRRFRFLSMRQNRRLPWLVLPVASATKPFRAIVSCKLALRSRSPRRVWMNSSMASMP